MAMPGRNRNHFFFGEETKMRKRDLVLASACAMVVLNGTVLATVTVDGSYDPDYGSAITLTDQQHRLRRQHQHRWRTANGSELDAVYGVVQNGYLNLLFTGNLGPTSITSTSSSPILRCQAVKTPSMSAPPAATHWPQ